MKNKYINSAIFLLIVFSSNLVFAQSKEKYTDDENARIKFAVHLVTYDTIGSFDNALGEATCKLLVFSFLENQICPKIDFAKLSSNDMSVIKKYINSFDAIKNNPPTWDELLLKETQYQIWLDASQHRKSKYKN